MSATNDARVNDALLSVVTARRARQPDLVRATPRQVSRIDVAVLRRVPLARGVGTRKRAIERKRETLLFRARHHFAFHLELNCGHVKLKARASRVACDKKILNSNPRSRKIPKK
jgi:hypothetical protein